MNRFRCLQVLLSAVMAVAATRRRFHFLLQLVIALMLLACAGGGPLAVADTIALTTTPGLQVNNNGDWVLGYSFTVNTSIDVTSLGVYDYQADGLSGSHDVGLWTSSGALLASTTVPAGTGAILDSSFRFTSITAVPLTAGETYYVGATKTYADGDIWLPDPLSLVAAPEITYVGRQYEFYSGTLVFPGLSGSSATGYFGGNFQFSSVPEPSTIVLAALGVVSLGLVAVRKKYRRA
jgi:hypothetical protein